MFEKITDLIIKSTESKILSVKATPSIMPIDAVLFSPGRIALPAVPALAYEPTNFTQEEKPAVDASPMVKPVSGRSFVPGYQEITVFAVNILVMIETVSRLKAEGFPLPIDGYLVPMNTGFIVMYRIPKITDNEIKLFRAALKKTKSKDGYNQTGMDALALIKEAAKAALSDEEKAKAKADKAKAKEALKSAKVALTPEEKAANKAAAAARAAKTREENKARALELMNSGEYDTSFITSVPATPSVQIISVEKGEETIELDLNPTVEPAVDSMVEPTVVGNEDPAVDEWPGATNVFGEE